MVTSVGATHVILLAIRTLTRVANQCKTTGECAEAPGRSSVPQPIRPTIRFHPLWACQLEFNGSTEVRGPMTPLGRTHGLNGFLSPPATDCTLFAFPCPDGSGSLFNTSSRFILWVCASSKTVQLPKDKVISGYNPILLEWTRTPLT